MILLFDTYYPMWFILSNILIYDDYRCLYGEMKVRDAILKGTTEAEQLELIYKLFGTPSGDTMLLCHSVLASFSVSLPLSSFL